MIVASLLGRINAASTSRTINRRTNLLLSQVTSLTSIMKFQPTILTAVLATVGHSTTAWMMPTIDNNRHQCKALFPSSARSSFPTDLSQFRRRFSSFSSSSSLPFAVTADDILETQQEEQSPTVRSIGKAIAKGSIVSSFRGGLVAVRVDDDLMTEDPSPQVVDTTRSLPPMAKTKSNSNTLGR
jgi:hypothetical protein